MITRIFGLLCVSLVKLILLILLVPLGFLLGILIGTAIGFWTALARGNVVVFVYTVLATLSQRAVVAALSTTTPATTFSDPLLSDLLPLPGGEDLYLCRECGMVYEYIKDSENSSHTKLSPIYDGPDTTTDQTTCDGPIPDREPSGE